MKIFRKLPRWFTFPFTMFLLTRLLVVGALYIPSTTGFVLYESPTFNFAPLENVPAFLRPWARWDSAWYVRIADTGYHYVPNSSNQQENDVAFFPLYPVLMRAGAVLVGNSLLAGIIISNVFFLLALIVLYRFTEQRFNPFIACRTIIYITIFPTSFFFSVAYTESLFLLVSVLAAFCCSQQKWARAGLCAAIASATRAHGIILIILIGLEWAKSKGWDLAHIRQGSAWQNLYKGITVDYRGLISVFLVPVGLLLYMLYLQVTFDNALAFNAALGAWGRQTVGPFVAISSAITRTFSGKIELSVLPYYRILEIMAFFISLWLSVRVYQRMGAAYGLYCLISIWVSASGLIQGQLRYSIVLFPLFIILAVNARPRFHMFYCTVCFILLPVFTFFFTNWIFVG